MVSPRFLSLLLLLRLLSGPSLAWAQAAPSANEVPSSAVSASLQIQVEGKAPTTITDEDLLKMPQRTVKVKEHSGEVTFTGVLLHDLLVKAGAPAGAQLHGKALSSYVLASAKDGYQAVFTLTEMDPGFTDDLVLVADRANGAALPETQGPFQIVVAHDKKPARSVRMLEKVEVVQLRH